MFFATKRATILIPSGTQERPGLKHLFVILSDPFGNPPQCLMASMSRIVDGAYHDPTCVLYAGDHPFLKVPSFIRYRKCGLEYAARLEAGVKSGLFIQRDMMDGAIVARILKGCIDSPQTALEIKNLIIQKGWVTIE